MDIGPAKTSPVTARPNTALKRLRLAAAITAGLALLAGAGQWIYRHFTHVIVDDARIAALYAIEVGTQSFNTTTSMGRLTLNILLSFAQFEREVIGERMRCDGLPTRIPVIKLPAELAAA